VTEDELLHRLTREFRRVGYEGASLTSLSEATGLKKASLYHRFPGGKEQMAREVLAAAHEWLDCHILQPLRSDRSPRERVEAMVRELDAFYDGGRQACLLNVFAAPLGETGPFAEMVREVLVSWLEALTATLVESGIEYETARKRARRAIALIQGNLVVARGLQTTAPFQESLAELRRELLGELDA
jgi:AcrR family transcriptional regulator